MNGSDKAQAEHALEKAKELKAGRGVRSGRELTPALAELAARKGALDSTGRREADRLLARPTDGAADPQGDGYSVSEATPYCSANFCVHYVKTTPDAPSLSDTDTDGVPDYVETMSAEFEFVHSIENGVGALGWVEPKSDGAIGGGSGLTDVYIKDIGDSGIFGYAAPEENGVSSYAYQVMDDDYAEFAPTTPPDALKVTAAHEYNHILQFTYDSIQDIWMFEATATWAEEKVYPATNDYLNYLNQWRNCTETPLTAANPSGTSCDLKLYGSAVWNHWLDARHGHDVVRRAWEVSDVTTPTPHFAPDAYDESVLAEAGGVGFSDEFSRFSARVAEWRAPGSPSFPDAGSYPDAERIGTSMVVNGAARSVQLDHTTFALIGVTPPASGTVELQATAPAGLNAAVALVGRTGSDPAAGTVVTALQRLPSGGSGSVRLDAAGSYGRITAVLVNADPSQSGFSDRKQDWTWTRDAQSFQNVHVVPVSGNPPPVVTIESGPADGGTSGPDVSFSFSANEAGAAFECRLDGSPFSACTSPRSLAGLAAGTHTFEVRAIDGNGGASGPVASRSWTVAVGGSSATSPPPPSNTTLLSPPPLLALSSKLGLRSPQRRSTVLSRGLFVGGRCNQKCALRYEVRLERRTARRLGLPRVIGRRSVGLAAAGAKNFRVRLTRRARLVLRWQPSVRLLVRMRAIDPLRNSLLKSGRVRVRR